MFSYIRQCNGRHNSQQWNNINIEFYFLSLLLLSWLQAYLSPPSAIIAGFYPDFAGEHLSRIKMVAHRIVVGLLGSPRNGLKERFGGILEVQTSY